MAWTSPAWGLAPSVPLKLASGVKACSPEHQVHVVCLAREALIQVGGGVRGAVVHADLDDDRRSAVEVGLG
jgi:hypothetical protein